MDDNGTRAYVSPKETEATSPNGTSFWDGGGPYTGRCTNPLWSTYASDWPVDPSDSIAPYRWPVMHYSDDFITGETYTHLALAGGGVIPGELGPNDYLRWTVDADADDKSWTLAPNTSYAFVLLFDEPASPGVKRNLPLSNTNVLPVGVPSSAESAVTDPFPGGHMIRRDGRSTVLDEVFILDTADRADVESSRRSSAFPILPDGPAGPERAAGASARYTGLSRRRYVPGYVVRAGGGAYREIMQYVTAPRVRRSTASPQKARDYLPGGLRQRPIISSFNNIMK